MHHLLPETVRTMLELAGVVPVMVPGLNREAWLTQQVRSGERPLLLIHADISPERLDVV